MTIAIVGSESLLARELREQLEQRGLKARVELFSAAPEQILSAGEDEPFVFNALTREGLEDVDAVLLAGDAQSSRKALELAPARAAIIDLTGALEEEPEARLRSGPRNGRFLRVVPHPAALSVARVLECVHAASPLRRPVVIVFEPASERGQAGINELQQQTASLLSFRPLDKKVFDVQLSFALLPRYGSEAPLALNTVEQRIDRHLATLLEGAVPMPSLRLVQAPVFHGHSMSFWLEFENAPDIDALTGALASCGFDVRGSDVEPPTNVGIAGQTGIAVTSLEPDRADARAAWLWAVSDNYRIVVDEAIEALAEAGVR